MDEDWLVLQAVAGAGADAIEVGIPFSDPMMDGPVIQAAGSRALERGATPQGILAEVAKAEVDVPLVVMTYQPRVGPATTIAGLMAESGVAGAIVPDLPLEELGPWARPPMPGARDRAPRWRRHARRTGRGSCRRCAASSMPWAAWP